MYLWSLRLGALLTCLFLGLLQVFAAKIDDLLVCKICNGYQICGRKHSQTPECLNGIPCTVQQYRLCGMMVDTITNQKCDYPGIFPDPKCPRKYYTCNSKKNTSSFEKRTRVCPAQKTFDPVTKHCLSTDEKLMLQVVQNYNRLKTITDDRRFVCQKVGIFPDPHDCKIYHSCNRKLESQDFYCPEGTYFDGVNCTCTKTHRCLSQLEENSKNQLKRGEEIYTRVRKLLATSTIAEVENGFKNTTGTNYTHYADDYNPIPESVNQTLRSMWDLQKNIRDIIHELQKMSEMSFTDLQNLQDTLTTVAEKMTKKVKIMMDYTNEKICSEVKKLGEEGSLKLKLSLCNTDVKCYCLQNDNGTNQNWRNLSTLYTIPVPITNTQTTQSPPHDVTTTKSYINTTTEHAQRKLPNRSVFTETTRYHKTETDATTHAYSSNSIQQEQTSNYETEQTTSSTHKTTTSSSPIENKTKYEETTSVIDEITTTVPHNNTKTPDSTVWERSTDGNFTGEVYNEIDIGQTVLFKETTVSEFYPEHSTVDDEAQEGKTSNYKTTKISTTGNYPDTTPQVDNFTNNDDKPHVTRETTFPSKNKTATTEINTTIEVYVTTARSDMEYSSDIHTTYYIGTNSTTANDTNTAEYSTETTHQIYVYTNDKIEDQTASSGESMTTVESDTEYQTVNEETDNGNTIAEHTITTVEPYSKGTSLSDAYTDKDKHGEGDTHEEKFSPMHEPKTTESPIETTLNTDVHTNEEDDGQETLKEQTLLYQTEHSTLNEETNDGKTTTSLAEKLTTIGFDNETTLHEDTHTNTEDQELFEKETAPDFEHKSTTTEFHSDQSSNVQDDTEQSTSYSPFELSTTGFYTETTPNINVRTHDEDDNQETLKEQTVLYQTEHSTLNDDTNDSKTTALEENLTTTGFDNETTLHEDTHTNNEVQENETAPDFEHKSTTTEFYSEKSSDVQEDSEPKTSYSPFEPSTTGLLTETTLHIDGRTNEEDDSQETDDGKTTTSLAEKLTTTGFNNEATLHEGTHTHTHNTEDQELSEKETAHDFEHKSTTTEFHSEQTSHGQDDTEPKTSYSPFEPSTTGFHSETTLHIHSDEDYEKETTAPFTTAGTDFNNEPTSYNEADEEITHPPTKGTDSESTTEANREYGEEAFTPVRKSATGGSRSETTIQVHEEYDAEDQNYTNDEYDIDDEDDTDVQYDYSVTYDVKTTYPFNGKNTATEFSTESMPHSINYTDSEERYTTRESETSTKYISTAYGESTSTQTPKSYRKFTSTPKTIKTESQGLNPERNPRKGTTSNRSYKTTANHSTSEFTIRRDVTTEMTLSTILRDSVITAKPPGPFRCSQAGCFVDPEDCHSFYRCSAVLVNRKPCSKCNNEDRWKLVETHRTCKNGRWFSRVLHKCVKFKPLLC